MKGVIISLVVSLNILVLSAQNISIANEQMNIFYVACDNPISIAVEDYPMKDITIKTLNGVLSNERGYYSFRPETIGKSEIILYKTDNNSLVEIGRKSFRSKRPPPPTLKIGPGGNLMPKSILCNQEYVRAELDGGCGITGNAKVLKFNLTVRNNCTRSTMEFSNIGNRLSDEILKALLSVEIGDTLIFDDIVVEMPGFYEISLEPYIVMVR